MLDESEYERDDAAPVEAWMVAEAFRRKGERMPIGGLGVIGSGYLSGEELRKEIRIVRERTKKPFGVHILFAATASKSEESLRYTNRVQEQIDVTLDEKVPVLISGLGNPLLVIDEAHRRGMKVMSVVGNARQARKLVDDGEHLHVGQGEVGPVVREERDVRGVTAR